MIRVAAAIKSLTVLVCLATTLAPAAATAGPPAAAAQNIFVPDAAETLCRVDAAVLRTPLDCAFARAVLYRRQHQGAVELLIGPGVWETDTGLQTPQFLLDAQGLPGGPGLIVRGAGKGEFGGGTVLRLRSRLSAGVVTLPFLPGANHFWSDVNLTGFTVDANGLAPLCFDLYALRVAHLENLSCTGAIGDDTWIRIGGLGEEYGGTVPHGFSGGAFQVVASDVFVYHNGYAPEAEVDALIDAGSIRSYRIRNAGHFREHAGAGILLKGADAATAPCKQMPAGLKAELEPIPHEAGLYRLARITQSTGGFGCKAPVRVAVFDSPAAAFGFRIAATDSSFYDLTDDSVGRIAGIEDRVSEKSIFVHPHIWNAAGGMELWGAEVVIAPELDSLYNFGILFAWGHASVVTEPMFVYLKHPAYESAADFRFADSAADMSIANGRCSAANPNAGYLEFAGRPPVGLHVSDVSACGCVQAPSRTTACTSNLAGACVQP